MANTPIKMYNLRRLLRYYTQGISKKQISVLTSISRNTVKRYIHRFITLYITYEDVDALSDQELKSLFIEHHPPQSDERFDRLQELLPQIAQQMNCKGVTLMQVWQQYYASNLPAYRFSQFNHHYSNWCKQNNTPVRHKKYQLSPLSETDLKTLKHWRNSSDRRKWERAVVLLESCKGTPVLKISQQVERTPDKVKDWIKGIEKATQKTQSNDLTKHSN